MSRGPGFHAGPALGKPWKGAHRRELEKGSARRKPPSARSPSPPSVPAAASEGDWALLLEQMGALALRAGRREPELGRGEARVEEGERALERRRRARREEERAFARAGAAGAAGGEGSAAGAAPGSERWESAVGLVQPRRRLH